MSDDTRDDTGQHADEPVQTDNSVQPQSDVSRAADALARLEAAVNSVVIGQKDVVRQVLTCLVAGGHVLVEGVPGLGKTLLVRSLAGSIGCDHGRIQFTPDLMPSDVTGHTLFNMRSETFEVRRGPVFTNLLLADEINRAPAKTQAALLEVMQERRVTIEGESHDVGNPFMVLATQNPIEQDGTYPLPEAQLDRFIMKVLIDYPSSEDEIALVTEVTSERAGDGLPKSGLNVAMQRETLLELQTLAAGVDIDAEVMAYLVAVARATRESVGIAQGAGPRAGLALARAGRVMALMAGRDFVVPDDIKQIALPVLRHRVALAPELEIEGADPDSVLQSILDDVPAPRR